MEKPCVEDAHMHGNISHAADVLKKIEHDRDGDFCDLTIVAGSLRLPVHKVIVCAQSQLIRTACTGPWKEAASGVFEVMEWPAELVRRMIDYMYTGTYAHWPTEAEGQGDVQREGRSCLSEPMVFHANMAGLADMYMVGGLHKLAEARFKVAVRRSSNPRRLLNSVSAIYALEADSCTTLRKTIILWWRWLAARTSDADDVAAQLKDVMAKVPEFATDFAMAVYHEPVLGRCSTCGDDEIVPVEPLQCRCQRCGKGGASTLVNRFNFEQRNGWV